MNRRPALRVVSDDEPKTEAPKFIGPDYAAIRARNWRAIHERSDKREPLHFEPRPGRWSGDDLRRFER